MTTPPEPRPTHVQTFYGRRGRLRTRSRDALARLLPVLGVEATGGPLDPVEVFGRRAPLVLEIGSGMGDATVAMAHAAPDHDFLAAEVHAPGVARLLLLIEEGGLRNVRVVHGDALELLRQRIAPASLAAIHVLFPDPWPKARHHKRRLFQPEHAALLRDRLAPGGVLHAVTDWPEYARVVLETLTADPALANAYDGWAPRPAGRPVTRSERKAAAARRPVYEVAFRRR
jgi:tRNA (guanine-N7-)-methyltransferase